VPFGTEHDYSIWRGVRDMLCSFGQKIKRLEHLEGSGNTSGKLFVVGLRAWETLALSRRGQNLTIVGDFDYSNQAEWTTCDIFDQPLRSGMIPGLQPD
jgi:hypothetical protein